MTAQLEPLDAVYTVVGDEGDIAPDGPSSPRDKKRAALSASELQGLAALARPRWKARAGRTSARMDALRAYEPYREYRGYLLDMWV